MVGISEEAIRLRAYLIWEREGRPDGRDFEHWLRAQDELRVAPKPSVPAADATAAPAAAAPRAKGNGAASGKATKSGATRPSRGKR